MAGSTDLYKAAERNEVAKVERLLRTIGVDPDWVAENGETPLYAAAAKGHAESISALLIGGADVNLACETPWGGRMGSPLYVAAENGHKEAIKVLLEGGALWRMDLDSKFEGEAHYSLKSVSLPSLAPPLPHQSLPVPPSLLYCMVYFSRLLTSKPACVILYLAARLPGQDLPVRCPRL